MSTIRRWIADHEVMSMTLAITAIVLSLYTVEQAGMPASVRGNPVYNTLTVPTHAAAPEHEEDSGEGGVIDERAWDFRERLCERVVRRFADDANAWERVIARVQKRFGFLCDR